MTKPAKATSKFDHVGDDLAAAPVPGEETSPEFLALIVELKADRPPPGPEPKLYGRRARGLVQLNVTVDPAVKKRLQRAADLHEEPMSDIVNKLLDRLLPRS